MIKYIFEKVNLTKNGLVLGETYEKKDGNWPLVLQSAQFAN